MDKYPVNPTAAKICNTKGRIRTLRSEIFFDARLSKVSSEFSFNGIKLN
jgi:hypothetical protein